MAHSNNSQVSSAVTDEDFASRVLRAPGIVLVDVWAPWCAPCVTLAPVLEKLASDFPDRLQLLMLDADSNPDTVEQYQVRSLPTVLVFRDGVLTARQTGAQSYGAYVALLDQVEGGSQLLQVSPTVQAGELKNNGELTASREPGWEEAQALIKSKKVLMLFKHSTTCPISAAAKAEFNEFVRAHPDLDTRVIIVQTERPLSNALASILKIQHESPQAILLRNGEVRWHASHGQITVETLERALAS